MRLLLPLLVALLLLPSAHAATSPAFGAAGTPRFDAYPADDTLRNANNAGEPSIGIPWDTGHAFFQAFSSTYRVTFDDARLEGGKPAVMWEDASPAFTPVNVDPMLHADHVSNRIWAGGLAGGCSLMGMSDDDGKTWLPAGNMCNFAQFDHQSIGSGKWAPNAMPRGNVYPRATYYCSQLQQGTPVGDLPGTACSTSLDGGSTWLAPTEVLGGCGGLHGHIRVSEATGTATVPDASCHSGEGSAPGGVVTAGPNELGFGYTTDNGATWNSRTIPGSRSGDGFDPSLAFSEHGWLYFAQADDQGVHVAMSKDEGRTWETLGGKTGGVEAATWLNLSAAYSDPMFNAPIKFGAFADVLAGDDDRAAVAFLGSTNPKGKHPFDDCSPASNDVVWHYYLAQTLDAGQTWTVTRLSEDPVQIGAIWNGGGGDPCRNLLDFADMDMDAHGRLHVAFADGCIDACAQKYADWAAGKGPAPKGTDSRASYATILRQTTGLGLFAKEDGQHADQPQPTPTGSNGTPGVGLVATLAVVAVAVAFRRR